MDTVAQRLAFSGASRLTDAFPAFGAHLLDATVRPLAGSHALAALFARRNRAIMRRVKAFRRFLVIPDIHIGDAVLTQPALAAVRDFFPDAEIDYVINKTVAPLIEGHPDATRILPLFSGGIFPSPADVSALRELIRTGRYDLCLAFSSLLEPGEQADASQPFVTIMSHGPTIVRNESDPAQINHFSYQDYQFVRGVLAMAARPVRGASYPGTRATFADEAIEGAGRFAAEAGLAPEAPVVMFNPDGASPFTIMPLQEQVALVARIARDAPAATTILVGAGHTAAGIGQRLADALPAERRTKVRVIPPSVPLEVYAALIDRADVFVTGDTGPLHLAAARRYSRSGSHTFRNRTAVLSFFGATMPRMSGYASSQPGFLPTNQDAPSWCVLAGSRCHNITCLNKLYKTCRVVRCFEHLDVNALASVVTSHLAGLAGPASASSHPAVRERAPA
jgi:ADP-heptose:LPS heptosyltransferase